MTCAGQKRATQLPAMLKCRVENPKTEGLTNSVRPMAAQDGAVDCLLDLIEDLKRRGKKLEHLPPSFWTEAAHKILLHPLLADSSTAE